MTLSILCVTNNEHPQAGRFVTYMRWMATAAKAELVLGLDRCPDAYFRKMGDKVLDLEADKLQEDVLDQAIAACSGDWVLRLDDDEKCSRILQGWIVAGYYLNTGHDLYAFPRIYLYPDEWQYIANDGMYPDLQTRLGKKELMYGCNYVHAGNPHGTGCVVPYAIEHHKLLLRDLADRRKIAARYEALRPGAGSLPEYARYNLPEDFYIEFNLKGYTNGNFGVGGQ